MKKETQDLTIAVTGATGFIGSALISKLLNLDTKIRILSRSASPNTEKITYFTGDLSKLTLNQAEMYLDGVDYIVHCAASVKGTYDEINAVNVKATQLLATAAKNKNIKKFIFLSSIGVYGNNLPKLVSETQKLKPVGIYETSKAEAEKILIDTLSGKIKFFILRPANVYGQNMQNNSLRELISAIKHRYFVFIGPPGSYFHYIHVSSVIDIIDLLLFTDKAQHNIYNVSVSDTVEYFVDVVHKSLNIKRRHPRLPRFVVTAACYILNFLGVRLLTLDRISHLTCKTSYSVDRIERDFSFKPNSKIEVKLQNLLSENSGKIG